MKLLKIAAVLVLGLPMIGAMLWTAWAGIWNKATPPIVTVLDFVGTCFALCVLIRLLWRTI